LVLECSEPISVKLASKSEAARVAFMSPGRSYSRVESKTFSKCDALKVCIGTIVLVAGSVSIYLLVRSTVPTDNTDTNAMFFSYAPLHTRAPLIIDLHGAGAAPSHQWAVSRMHDCARDRGWHISYPAGVGNTWNAGPGMYPPPWDPDDPTDHVTEL